MDDKARNSIMVGGTVATFIFTIIAISYLSAKDFPFKSFFRIVILLLICGAVGAFLVVNVLDKFKD